MANELVIATSLAIVAIVVFHKYSSRKTTRSLPPGPPPIIIAGNALQIPQTEPWVWCGSLKQTYGEFYVLRFDGHAWTALTERVSELSLTFLLTGDVVHLSIFGKPMIILNSFSAINEFFVKKSKIHSDRPPSVMVGEMYVRPKCPNMLYARVGHSACLFATEWALTRPPLLLLTETTGAYIAAYGLTTSAHHRSTIILSSWLSRRKPCPPDSLMQQKTHLRRPDCQFRFLSRMLPFSSFPQPGPWLSYFWVLHMA